MIPTIELKHRLRLAREAAGLRGEDIALALEVKRTTISNYENGHTRPRKPTLVAWSLATSVPVWWLEGAPEPESSDVTDRSLDSFGTVIDIRSLRGHKSSQTGTYQAERIAA